MPSNVARLPSRPARPTIEIDGTQELLLEAALVEYAISDSIDGIASAEMRFGNWGGEDQPGFQHFNRQRLEFGKMITVKLANDVLFKGKISAIAGHFPEGTPPQISVLAEDRLQDLRMVRRTRSFENKSLAEIARTIASDHGLQPMVDVSGPTYAALAQVNQSDLALLHMLARNEGAQVWFVDDKLMVKKSHDAPEVQLDWAGTLHSFDVVADLAGQRTSVTASGWSVADKEAIKHKAGKSVLGSEIGSDEAAADILQSRFGERADQLAHVVAATTQEARSIAEASFRQMGRNFIIGEGVCETDPKLRIGAKLALTGLGPLFDGNYRIRSVTHLFDAEDGARSEFSADRPGLGRV
ncbi:MAG: contractile injection system protein, VgrG/Pvc8 family [Sphingorhabdus sp.]